MYIQVYLYILPFYDMVCRTNKGILILIGTSEKHYHMMIQIEIVVVAAVWDGLILFLPILLHLVPSCCAVIGFD